MVLTCHRALPAAVVQHPVATSAVILAGSSLLLSPYILLAGTAVVLLTGTKLLPGFLRPALPGPVSEVCRLLCVRTLESLLNCTAWLHGPDQLAPAAYVCLAERPAILATLWGCRVLQLRLSTWALAVCLAE